MLLISLLVGVPALIVIFYPIPDTYVGRAPTREQRRIMLEEIKNNNYYKLYKIYLI